MKFVKACKDGFAVGFIGSFVVFGFSCGKALHIKALEKLTGSLDKKVAKMKEEEKVIHADFRKGDANE